MEGVKFYYGREPETNHPKVTVCVLKDEESGEYYRGVSICSDSEPTINRQKGRDMTQGRAVKALLRQGSGLVITRKEAREVLDRCGLSFQIKSEYDAPLTEFERKLFREGEVRV